MNSKTLRGTFQIKLSTKKCAFNTQRIFVIEKSIIYPLQKITFYKFSLSAMYSMKKLFILARLHVFRNILR